ncbi:lipopolysaccharide heptosyltransferase II [Gemmatimonas aurantiaca]|nr:lipopolysaccharide heptosyltransferase II [Gemmatimonas aurantiaca]
MPKLILRSPNHVGDCVMSLSAVDALRELFRESEINVLAPDFVAGLYKRHPSVDNVITLRDAHHGVASINATHKALQKAGGDFEIGILFTDSLSAALGFKLAGVTNIYGHSGSGKSLLLRDSLNPVTRAHRTVKYQILARFSAKRFWENPYWVDDVTFESPAIYFSEVERAAAKTLVEKSCAGHFVAIAPQAVAESRRWGLENYSALAKRIIKELNHDVILVGSHADRDAADKLISLTGEHSRRVHSLCGATKLRGAAALLERASAFVGNDSGLAHLAALVNRPLVILSGADDPSVTSPLSKNKTVIREDQLECISCVKNKCPLAGDSHLLCMRQITVERVFDLLSERLP